LGTALTMDKPPENTPDPNAISPELRRAWRFSLFQQFAIVLTVIALDKRVHVLAAAIALVVFWAGLGFIIFLRRSKPILIDLLFVRWSFPLIWLVALLAILQITKARVH
jgi:hypothetical protein